VVPETHATTQVRRSQSGTRTRFAGLQNHDASRRAPRVADVPMPLAHPRDTNECRQASKDFGNHIDTPGQNAMTQAATSRTRSSAATFVIAQTMIKSRRTWLGVRVSATTNRVRQIAHGGPASPRREKKVKRTSDARTTGRTDVNDFNHERLAATRPR